MELTDLELNKKIAEIEGYFIRDYCEKTKRCSVGFLDKSKMQMSEILFSPLQWEFTGPLMVKHEISHYATLGNAFKQHRAFYEYITEDDEIERFTVMHKDLQRAILLAIVAKFEAVK